MEEQKRDTNEFTFKQLFNLIKKSRVLLLVLCLIAAFLVGAVGLTVTLLNKEKEASVTAVVDIRFQGIEDGLDPLGKRFDIAKIKSPTVIGRAITALDEQGIKIGADKLNDIRENLRIEGNPPTITSETELETLNYFPTRYKVSLTNLKELGFSRSTAIVLVDEIVKQYDIYFRETYIELQLLGSNVVSILDNENYDYIDLYDIFAGQINTASSYLSARNNEVPNFRSRETLLSFADLRSALNIVRNIDLENYKSYVLQNKVSQDSDFLTQRYTIQKSIKERDLKKETENANTIKDMLENSYKNGDIIIPTEQGVIEGIKGGPTEQYDAMHQAYIDKMAIVNTIQASIEELEDIISTFSENPESLNTPEHKAIADQKAMDLATKIQQIVGEANNLMGEYYDSEYMTGAVKLSVPAVYQANTVNYFRQIVVGFLLAEFVAVLTAVMITYFSLKKKGIPLD